MYSSLTNHNSRFAASRDPVPIKVVAAFLRLGQKYDFEAIRIEALHRIFYEVPTTLEDYDTLKTGSQIQKTSVLFWIDMLTVAHEHNLQSVLPFALYMCSTMIFFGSSTISEETDCDEYKARLAIDDRMKCLSSYRTLLRTQNDTTFAWLDCEDAYGSCDHVMDCHLHRNYLIREYFFNRSTIGDWRNGRMVSRGVRIGVHAYPVMQSRTRSIPLGDVSFGKGSQRPSNCLHGRNSERNEWSVYVLLISSSSSLLITLYKPPVESKVAIGLLITGKATSWHVYTIGRSNPSGDAAVACVCTLQVIYVVSCTLFLCIDILYVRRDIVI